MRLLLCLVFAGFLLGCNKSQTVAMPPHEALTLTARDGVKVYAYLSRAKSPKGVLLLFHQAGSSADEYAPLSPKLTAIGWDCLAVDLRSGGPMYGTNRTVEAIGKSQSYLEAYQDMKAATEYAVKRKYRSIVAWGSSYSASLVAKLSVDCPSISKVIAFSPGEYLDDKTAVRRWYSKVKVPILAVWAGNEESGVREVLAGTRAIILGDQAYVHGSSCLRPDKGVPHQDALWRRIEAFLNG